jgi:DNA polymerase III alpha subunit
MPALAITDTGNLFGALEFADAMKGQGVQPIVGCTLLVDCGDGPEGPQKTNNSLELSRLALIAKDETGLRQPDEAVEQGLSGRARRRAASRDARRRRPPQCRVLSA